MPVHTPYGTGAQASLRLRTKALRERFLHKTHGVTRDTKRIQPLRTASQFHRLHRLAAQRG
ncbi:hypothetical protein H3146_10600 [Streptomyces sp. OF3]|uniref:Uncharacterized protein n=1 Tax=Streptomyces alkaliterrae TaxID=2213162 RepID=A0A7W3ZMW9_9ACTN|nr:hypothetical protein [Streptomyces alkaliterrae]